MSDIDIRQATPDEWADLRAIRLAALADAPSAFGMTLAQELAYDEQRWRSWLGTCAIFLGRCDGRPVVIAGGIPRPDDVELIAVWAHPDTRGTGAGEAVVNAVIDWARGRRARRITAWAADNNDRALRFYRRLGFTPTGRDDAHGHDPTLRELELVRSLD